MTVILCTCIIKIRSGVLCPLRFSRAFSPPKPVVSKWFKGQGSNAILLGGKDFMKMTKKIISVLLAVMMVITMLPTTVFAATTKAKTDQVAVDAQAAMTAYENKMDGTIYKNMQAAYDAYLNVVKSYNVYVYGDTDNGLANYTQTLVNATNAMTADGIYDWSTYTGITSAVPTFNGTAVSDATLYGNIITAGTCTTSYNGTTDGSDTSGQAVAFDRAADTDVVVYHPEVVTVYDGKANIVVPVAAGIKKRANKTRRVYTVYPTAETGVATRPADHPFFKSLYLIKNDDSYNFKGKESNNSMDFNYGRNQSSIMGSAKNNNGHYSDDAGYSWGRYYWGWYATAFQITDDINFGTAGYMNFKPNWYWVGDSGTSNAGNTEYVDANMKGNKTSEKSIHIINLKGMLDLYDDAKARAINYSLNIEQYKNDTEGASLSNFFKGLDAATSLKLEDITGATTSTVASVGNTLSTAITYLPYKGTSLEGAGYTALRTNMDNTRSTYNSVNSDMYTTESWNAFTAAYDNAKSFMANSMTAGYHDDQAKSLADDLKAKYDALELSFTPADTSILEVLLDDALIAVANKDMFTAESYAASNIEANTVDCQVDIWQAVASYKDAASVCDANRQDDVDAWVLIIDKSIRGLELSKDAVVGSAYGYSMNSAIAEAGSLNAADYANFTAVTDAVQAAQAFDPRIITDTTDSSSLQVGMVSDKINEYTTLTRNIINAIKSLVASFIKMPDGQVVKSSANTVSFKTGCNHSDGKYYEFSYNYPTDVVLFRTEHGAKTLALPDSTIGFYATSTGESKMGPSYMDSFHIDSNIISEVPEIVTPAKYDDQDHSLPDPTAYPGKLTKAAAVNGFTYTLTLGNNSAYTDGVTGIFGKEMTNVGNYGRDLNGNDVTDSAFDWTDSLKNTSGKSAGKVGPVGSLIANYGWTYVTGTNTMNFPARNVARPAMTTIPVAENAYVSALIRYNYPGIAGRVYYGYCTNSTQYSQTVYTIDIAGLIDLINECSEIQKSNYTTASWNNFQAALEAATQNIEYGNLTAADILTQCQIRFDNLRDMRDLLVEAANNNSIDEALAQARVIKDSVDNGEARYSTSTYTAFLDARQAALDAVNGIYSDAACLELVKTQYQSTIDAIATALLEAIKNLASFADFTELNRVLTTALADKKFTVDALNEFNSFIASLTYANMSVEQQGQVEADFQADVDAETTAVTNRINSLVATAPADKSVFDAQAQLLADADPDAYTNIEDCLKVVDEYKANDYAKLLYTTVKVLGHDVIALNPQSVVDKAIENAMNLTLQQYTVYVDGSAYATYNFGDEAEVKFAKNSAIYYAYTSNTATNTAKYYTTDSIIRFIVKGNTYLTTKAADSTETAKVTFVNALRNKTYETDYVVKGSSLTLPEAPSVAYYEFMGYTVDGASYDAGDTVTVSKNTSVVANYEFAADVIDVSICFNMDGYYTLRSQSGEAIYNNLVELTDAGIKNHTLDKGKKYFGTTFIIDGTEIKQPSSQDCIYQKSTDPIVAYATVDYDLYDDFYDMYDSYIIESELDGSISYDEIVDDFAGTLKIVSYGPDYSFYASGDTLIFALTQEDYDHALAAGIIDVDQNGADVSVKSQLVDADTKWSIVGTYGIPEGATLVENGVLFTKNGSDLKMSNVDSQNVYRFKSSQHTVGNQFVISVKKPATVTEASYLAYTIYELGGKQYTVYSETVSNTMAPRA